jgi:hypothetical protein
MSASSCPWPETSGLLTCDILGGKRRVSSRRPHVMNASANISGTRSHQGVKRG